MRRQIANPNTFFVILAAFITDTSAKLAATSLAGTDQLGMVHLPRQPLWSSKPRTPCN